ncbi:nicotianamine synthase family protein [Methanobacterium alcaliphilum]|uniref:nicotianamine synthase family protein n=1 Tax=Methanobacterium alcaliphilum TaxID=392018 RepID=UPI00200AA7CC|nr:nicotianamine synthase family protein [Methanobacterium alcaliphilum]MCK9152053.1 methyltransferase [Methanobacterium alcaliphilum]
MSCYIYWKKISEIAENLKKYDECTIENLPLEKILPLLDDIEEIAHDKTIDFESAQHILDNERMANALKVIRKFYVDIGMKLETEKAYEILNSDSPWKTLESFHFFHRYEKLIRNEAHLAHYVNEDRVVFVGGGPLPLSLILINKFYGIKGVSIERSPEVADISRNVLKKMDLNEEISVLCGDETSLSGIDFDLVLVAALAEPKKRVFKNVRLLISEETRVIYRTYTGMRAILYSPVTKEDVLGFVIESTVLPSGKVNNTSILIKKE